MNEAEAGIKTSFPSTGQVRQRSQGLRSMVSQKRDGETSQYGVMAPQNGKLIG